MTALVKELYSGFWDIQIREGFNSIKFHLHGDQEKAERFAENAERKFQELLEELRNAA